MGTHTSPARKQNCTWAEAVPTPEVDEAEALLKKRRLELEELKVREVFIALFCAFFFF